MQPPVGIGSTAVGSEGIVLHDGLCRAWLVGGKRIDTVAAAAIAIRPLITIHGQAKDLGWHLVVGRHCGHSLLLHPTGGERLVQHSTLRHGSQASVPHRTHNGRLFLRIVFHGSPLVLRACRGCVQRPGPVRLGRSRQRCYRQCCYGTGGSCVFKSLKHG